MDTGASAPLLETERLTLRPLSEADAGALFRISNEPPVRRYLWDDEPVSGETIKGLILQSATMFEETGLGLFGLRFVGAEKLLGFCGFVRLAGMVEPELGYELTPEAWGGGLATEAALACVRYAFKGAGVERVIAGADPPNVASLRVLEKLGMRPAGNLNPTAPDEPYYVLRREDFFAPGSGKRSPVREQRNKK